MKRFLLCLAMAVAAVPAKAQQPAGAAIATQDDGKLSKYRRSSLYTVLVRHPEAKYSDAIDSAFMSIPTPDKFNNHDLPVKSFDAVQHRGKTKDEGNMKDIEEFIASYDVPKLMVAKWFDRDPKTGAFDMQLIQQRGNYDASQLDIRLADQGYLGRATLADAGEELIGKTFLLVNDITFVDVGEKSAKAGGWLRMLGAAASAATGEDYSSLTDATVKVVGEIDGFSVNITSYLYRLEWNDSVAANFYTYHWMDSTSLDSVRRMAFDTTRLFKVAYVGKTSASAGNLASKSLSRSKEEQMLKVCTRAIDKSIVQLQRDFDEFKVNMPIYKINGDGTLDVQIGLKEGVNVKSQFDVLMPVIDENGRTVYDKVGRIQPVEGKIWDNRFGADEDAAAMATAPRSRGGLLKKGGSDEEEPGNVSLTATTFRILSGANKIVPGCLVREVTIKRQ